MPIKSWVSKLLLLSVAMTGVARGDGHGRGHGNHDRDDDDRDRQYYSEHDRREVREWYHEHDHDDHLPPGLAKRDRLLPGLEKQLRVRARCLRGCVRR